MATGIAHSTCCHPPFDSNQNVCYTCSLADYAEISVLAYEKQASQMNCPSGRLLAPIETTKLRPQCCAIFNHLHYKYIEHSRQQCIYTWIWCIYYMRAWHVRMAHFHATLYPAHILSTFMHFSFPFMCADKREPNCIFMPGPLVRSAANCAARMSTKYFMLRCRHSWHESDAHPQFSNCNASIAAQQSFNPSVQHYC